MKKSFVQLLLLPAVVSVLIVCAGSVRADYARELLRDSQFRVVTDGYDYEGDVLFLADRAYVSLREFSCMADNCVVEWNGEREESTVTSDSLILNVRNGENYIEANGRLLWCEEGVFVDDGCFLVPLRQIGMAFGFDVSYSAEDNTAYLTRLEASIASDDEYYDGEELYWLSKIIEAESGDEPFLGKLAVGNVVLNRVRSEFFPSSIYDVIFDRKNGVQFTPTVDGAIEKEPFDDSVSAAKLCLENCSLSEDILYFLNEEIASSLWIVENCTYVMTIGSHDFYTD